MAPQVIVALLVVGQQAESPCVAGQPTEACEHALLTLSLNLEEQLYHEKVDRVRTEKKLLQCMTSSATPAPPPVYAPKEPTLPVWAWLLMILGAGAGAAATTYVAANN